MIASNAVENELRALVVEHRNVRHNNFRPVQYWTFSLRRRCMCSGSVDFERSSIFVDLVVWAQYNLSNRTVLTPSTLPRPIFTKIPTFSVSPHLASPIFPLLFAFTLNLCSEISERGKCWSLSWLCSVRRTSDCPHIGMMRWAICYPRLWLRMKPNTALGYLLGTRNSSRRFDATCPMAIRSKDFQSNSITGMQVACSIPVSSMCLLYIFNLIIFHHPLFSLVPLRIIS